MYKAITLHFSQNFILRQKMSCELSKFKYIGIYTHLNVIVITNIVFTSPVECTITNKNE